MIVVQTPLRVSFLGGGTDLREYYMKYDGAVLSSAIDKYVYVIVKERYDNKICLNYSKREVVEDIQDLQHELVREALRLTGIDKGLEITTLADIPGEGTGLGSSSSVTVGVLHALYSYLGELKTAEMLADKACHIEIDILGKPIGKQDQYIAAYGNTRFITFDNNGVNIEEIKSASDACARLDDNLLLFYTGVTRKSEDILSEQKGNIDQNLETLHEMKKLTYRARDSILNREFDEFGQLLHQGWVLKKRLASNISNPIIDEIYETARKAGAIAGKITGAGGGGFLLLYCPKEKQDKVRDSLKRLWEVPFHFEQHGSKVIFDYRSRYSMSYLGES